jgi:N-methylhydantoinase A
VVSARAIAIARTAAPVLARLSAALSADAADALVDPTHLAYFDGQLRPTPIYQRDRLLAGHQLTGPAIIVEMDSTTLIEPGWEATVDAGANILIRGVGAP